MEEYSIEIEREIKRIAKLVLSEETLEELHTISFLANDVATVVSSSETTTDYSMLDKYYCLAKLSELILFEYEFERIFPYELISKYLYVVESYLLSRKPLNRYEFGEVLNITNAAAFMLKDIGNCEENVDIIIEAVPDNYKLVFYLLIIQAIPTRKNHKNDKRKEKMREIENKTLQGIRQESLLNNLHNTDTILGFKKLYHSELIQMRWRIIDTIDTAKEYNDDGILPAIVSFIKLSDIVGRYGIEKSQPISDIASAGVYFMEIYEYLRKWNKRTYRTNVKTVISNITDVSEIAYVLQMFARCR